MLSDIQNIRSAGHRKNIERYRSILASDLTSHERAFVERRIAEEEASLRELLQSGAPFAAAQAEE